MDEGSFCRRSNVFGADLIVIFPSWVLRSPCMIGEIALQSRSQMMFEPVWVTWYSTPLLRAMCACRRHPVMVCRRLFMTIVAQDRMPICSWFANSAYDATQSNMPDD